MKKATNKEMLDWTAVAVLCLAVGALGLIVIFNHSLAIVISPLVVLIPLYYLIKWAACRTYQMWKESESEPIGNVTKGVVAVVIALLLPTAPAKALDDDLAGGYAGLYTHFIGPTLNSFWQVWWFNFTQTFQGTAPTPAPWNQIQKDRDNGR